MDRSTQPGKEERRGLTHIYIYIAKDNTRRAATLNLFNNIKE